jgi:hypothetical protein
MRSSAYNTNVAWKIELLSEVADWLDELPQKDYENVVAALEALRIDGPNLGRPFVGKIEGSSHKNMKELRPPGGHLRLLFAFDPTRRAIFLVAGDKTNVWREWYERNIPVADKRFDSHLRTLKRKDK